MHFVFHKIALFPPHRPFYLDVIFFREKKKPLIFPDKNPFLMSLFLVLHPWWWNYFFTNMLSTIDSFHSKLEQNISSRHNDLPFSANEWKSPSPSKKNHLMSTSDMEKNVLNPTAEQTTNNWIFEWHLKTIMSRVW